METSYSYDTAKDFVKNKDSNLDSYIKYMLCRTNEMFVYTGLPETIPQDKLEHILQTTGSAFITKVNGNLYALKCSKSGEQDVYEDSKNVQVNNIALKYNKELVIDKDGVLITNDLLEIGLLPILYKYGALLTDCEISLNMISIILRAVFLISACDDETKQSADTFIKKIYDGDYSVIGDSAFFDGVKIQGSDSGSDSRINQFIELTQYIKGSAFHEIGLNANYNLKRERLTSNEVELNNDALIPYTQNMIDSRKKAIDKINKMYDLSITVELSGVWKANSEELEKATNSVETENVPDTDTEPTKNDSVTDTDKVPDTVLTEPTDDSKGVK